MKNSLIIVAIVATLAACGGGGGGSAPSAAPVVAPTPVTPAPTPAPAPTPTPTPTPAPAPTPTPTAQPPAVSSTASTVNGNNNTVATSGMDWVVKYAGTVNITLSGTANNLWMSDNQAGGTISISGNSNVVVFRPGATAAALVVTGLDNTFWLPSGAPITLTGSGAASSTTKTYTP